MVDVSHEVVPFTPDAQVAPVKIYTTAEITALYVAQLSPAEAQLAELEEKFAKLTGPISVTDKTAYKAGKDAWREVQAFRTKVENQALSMRREQNTINKAIATKEGQIVDRASPLEARLQVRWKAVDDENDRLEREETERQEQQLRERLADLTGLGMTLVDGYYSIADRVTIDMATLRVMPLEKFNKFRQVVVGCSNELQQVEEKRQQEEQKRQQQLESERQQARQANKETRSMVLDALGLVPQKDGTLLWTDGVHRLVESEEKLYDLDHYGFTEHVKIIKGNIKDFQETKKRLEQQEKELLQRLARENRDKSRMHALAQAGLHPRGAHVVYEDGFSEPLRVPFDELLDLEDDNAFSDRVVELSNQVGILRTNFNNHHEAKRLEAEALRLRKKEIASMLQQVGFIYNFNIEAFEFKQPRYSASFQWEALLQLDNVGFDDLIIDHTKKLEAAIEEQDKLYKAEQERLEKERLAGMNDDQIWSEYLQKLRDIARPSVDKYKLKKSTSRQARFYDRLETLVVEFMPMSIHEKEVHP